MGGLRRPTITATRSSMRPPPRPNFTQHASMTGRAPSPADSSASSNNSGAGTKRKERDFEEDHGEETNIHVVVRCRGRNEREVRENSGVVVSTTGVKGKNVELSMGPNAISNKTYQFDKVFSPAADQAIIFEDVVAPILSEMLTGFNCTIFAYGQTGTGKTYTMSGDMTDNLGLLSDAAGIIPRVLSTLFQKLETDEVECSVKCSFIELYNEELRDLLAADDSVKLKIYDDANKKSHTATMVQGMEESYITSSSAGIKLLQQGSYRRQVAATKCNDLSSRSHTVFTITTYIKKVNEAGEDYICTGKLNLVDLAGSENIQRSGAENKRAVEAGVINKSLLTLGRVINALVDKSSHIPYRESKLTRLLQDSLGGRTKTCIIATVSPARSNLEETISTLDYAFRAKNIRNKPQVNSMISKQRLLKEFTMEIEKIKSELIATRQRNGVYLTNDQYEVLTVESESRRILSEEQKARIETMEVSLRNKVQELFSLTNNFTMLKRDNEATRATLASTKDVLVKTDAVLADTQRSLAEETVLREAHEATEERLLDIGTRLVSKVDMSTHDVNGLHAGLERQSNLHNQNRNAWTASVDRVNDVSDLVEARMQSFQAEHSDMIRSSRERIDTFVSAQKKHLETSARLAISKALDVEKSCSAVEAQSGKARDDMNTILEEIKDLRESVKEKVGEGLQGLSQAAAKISAEVISELEDFHTQLHTSYSGLGKDIKNMFDELTKQLSVQREEADALRFALQAANRANIEAQLAAASQLQTVKDEEKRGSKEEKEMLKEQIFRLIDASSLRQEERLSDRLISTQTNLVDAAEQFEKADKSYLEGMDKWTDNDINLMTKVVRCREDIKTKMKGDWTSVNTRNNAIQKSTRAIHEETVKIVDAQLGQVATQMADLDEFVGRARSQNDSYHQQRTGALTNMANNARGGFVQLEKDLNDCKTSTESFGNENTSHGTDMEALASSLEADAKPLLEDLQNVLANSTFADYQHTGETPQKREWDYPTNLPRTESHESIIARLRGLPDPAAASKRPSTSKTPGRSPRKQTSPKKGFGSPSKALSPSKTKVFMDFEVAPAKTEERQTGSLPDLVEQSKAGLKEVDINVIPRAPVASMSANADDRPVLLDFSKSLGSGAGQPPLKRHATTNAIVESRLPTKLSRAKSTATGMAMGLGVENLGQSVGPGVGGRRLRSSPPN
ncbi:Kinesin-related motor protein [Elasticomyces elasticus]|uniref:Kinesin- motor protein n=1 Tax=Exophiala sideris TaxID=1016849 RepID=A0ABR0J9K7_9EURO|nr:Kinesin-related motor protein [Elasticomyces elasticus]KAK5022787.1 Kinesin- motor protein [Exophiala sideris]KAK5026689.1 Kinesin-related motor protein [Exophiala sideris]KAK5059414.1 Kinesin- motor protein [Exophiala sideris]KAK5177441.1 Kinesin- motor protein [Eurotiomycetes sp. CCFEE 6388]